MSIPSSPTIRDVAKKAGVSTATVSHVFNKSRWVSPDTREKVLLAARSLNYRPSAIARSLSTKVTQTIGVIVADITNPFFASLARGIEDHLWGEGYNMIVCNTDEQQAKEARYLQLLLERRVDGVAIASTGYSQPIYQEFALHNIPLVFVDRRPPENAGPVVEIDNFQAGYIACQALIQLDHRGIAILARNRFLSTVIGRIKGYQQALLDNGIAAPESLVKTTEPNLEEAAASSRELLSQPDPPTAIIAANHVMALGALQAIQSLGLKCPEDISIITFDDPPWASLFSPPLTVIKQPITELSEHTAKILLQEIKAKNQLRNQSLESVAEASTPEDILLQAELVTRGSCGRPKKSVLPQP